MNSNPVIGYMMQDDEKVANLVDKEGNLVISAPGAPLEALKHKWPRMQTRPFKFWSMLALSAGGAGFALDRQCAKLWNAAVHLRQVEIAELRLPAGTVAKVELPPAYGDFGTPYVILKVALESSLKKRLVRALRPVIEAGVTRESLTECILSVYKEQ